MKNPTPQLSSLSSEGPSEKPRALQEGLSSARAMRIVLVGRHFWPHGSIDAAGHLMDLASDLQAFGAHVTVVTPKFAASWADQFEFRELSVQRPLRMFRTGWTTRGDRTASRYVKNLRDFLAKNLSACDLMYCDSAREECIATVQAAQQCGVPSVVRIAGNGINGDVGYLENSRSGKRFRAHLAMADAVVVSQSGTKRWWHVRGGDIENVHRIHVGIGSSIDSNPDFQRDLRRALARINGDLHVPSNTLVAMSTERLQKDSGVMTLVESAYSLSQQVERLQYWLLGDGPARDSIYLKLKGDGLRQRVAMPGSFSTDTDAYAAADLMIHTGEEGFDHQIPSAIAAALPLIVANTETAREFFGVTSAEVSQWIVERRPRESTLDNASPSDDESECSVWWYDPTRPKTLRFAIEQIAGNVESARGRARRVRRHLQRIHSRRETIQQYLKLFQQLV